MKQIIGLLLIIIITTQISKAAQIDTNRVYGVTIDDISNLSGVITSLSNLCKKPTTRIVFDEWQPATYYQTAVNQIHNVSFIMGEICDSYYTGQYTLAQYVSKTNEYLNLLGSKVDIWEVGNEVNGEWCGTISDVITKIDSAYSIVKAAGKTTEMTLYYNKNCWSNSHNEMFYWVNQYLPASVRNGLNYVLVSYYEDDCNGLQPNWQQVFDSLHVLFPNSKLGMGECGTSKASNKASYITRYYTENITTPKYVGGYFWWYYYEDCIPSGNTLWTTLNNAISNVAAPTVQATNVSYSNLTSTTVNLSWTSGNGSNRLVFFKDGTTGTPTLINGISYTANSSFGLGTSDGTGFYCVYNGSATMAPNITISGLTSGHSYRVMVVEYNGNPGFQGYNIATSATDPIIIQGILPVELSSFTSDISKNNVTLKWTTAMETNNQGFSVQRTVDGNEVNWVEAGYIKGAGNSNSPVNYEFTDKNLQPGKYQYRLKQIDYNGNYEFHNLSGDVNISAPNKFEMAQNYPNPFNPTTSISYALPEKNFVTIKIYDNLGREITTLVSEEKAAGIYTVTFDGSKLSSGIYFYKLESGKFTAVKRMLLIK